MIAKKVTTTPALNKQLQKLPPTVGYNPAGYVRGGATPPVARAIQAAAMPPRATPTINVGKVVHSYNPAGYVPGNASHPVAQAIQRAATGPALNRAAAAGGGGAGKVVAKTPQDQLMALVMSYFKGAQSPEQQQANIKQGIQDEITAQTTAATQANNVLQAQYAQQARRAAGFAGAIGSLQATQGQQAYSDYERAAQNIQGLGTGLTGAVQQTEQASADKAAADIAQASGGINTAGTNYDLSGLRNIAQYTGVVNPSRDLFTEAANQAAGARLQNVSHAQTVMNVAQDFIQKGTDADKKLAADKLTIQAQRPDLYFKAVQAAQQGRTSDVATLVSAFALQNNMDATQAKIINDKLNTKITGLKATGDIQAKKIGAQTARIKVLKGAVTDAVKAAAAKTTAAASTKRADTGATVAATKITGYQPDGKTLLPNYYKPDPKGVPQNYDPKHYRVVTNPNGTQRLVPLAKPPAAVSTGFQPDGKTLLPGFYQPTKGGVPQPYDPKHYKVVTGAGGAQTLVPLPKAATPGAGKKGGLTASGQQTAIDNVNRQLPSLKAPGTYSTVTNALAVKYGGVAPIYKPAMSLAAAIAQLRTKYPVSLRNDSRVTTAIREALGQIGYKV